MAFRHFLNKIGRVFNPLLVREVFAEDMNEIQDRIVALENATPPTPFVLKTFNGSFGQSLTGASTDISIAHGLGKIPKGIDVQAGVTYDLLEKLFNSYGHSDGSSNTCVAVHYESSGAPYFFLKSDKAFYIDDNDTPIACTVTFDVTNINFHFTLEGAVNPRYVVLAYQVVA